MSNETRAKIVKAAPNRWLYSVSSHFQEELHLSFHP